MDIKTDVEELKKEGIIPRFLYIMRGTPGCGKTAEANEIAQQWIAESDNHVPILSTDDFWEEFTEGKVVFGRYGEAHSWNFKRFLEWIVKRHIQAIIIDNTNMQFWEYQNYMEVASMHGYQVRIIDLTPDGIEGVLEAGKRNKHGVPLWKCLEMYSKYQPH